MPWAGIPNSIKRGSALREAKGLNRNRAGATGKTGATGAQGPTGSSGTADFDDLLAGANITAPALVAVNSSGQVVEASSSESAVIGVLVTTVTTGNPATVRPAGYIAGVTANEAISIGDTLTFSGTAGRLAVFDPQVTSGSTGTYDGANHTSMPTVNHVHDQGSHQHNHNGNHSHSVNGLPTDTETVGDSTHDHDVGGSTANTASADPDSGHLHTAGTLVANGNPTSTVIVASDSHGHGTTTSNSPGATDSASPGDTGTADVTNRTNIPNTDHTHSGASVTPKQGQLVGRALSAAAGSGNTFNMLVILG